jgi:mRNA-degrading endonuclease RelE of RelBE toxin-antitoxin system
MNAAEIIEQIKKLPREEQEQVFAFIRSLVESGALRDEPSVHYMDAAKAKAVSAEIFSERAELFRKLAS